MKNPTRQEDGMYHIGENKYPALVGSRAQVFHETAYKTSGGLTKKDLMKNKHGRIVSSKKHKTAKKEKRLVKYGYSYKKGKFGYVKKSTRRRKLKGGSAASAAPAVVATPVEHVSESTLLPATV